MIISIPGFKDAAIAVAAEIRKNQLLYAKTNIGGFFFDAFLKLNHSSKLRITDHPTQTGANISDHSFMEPKELTIEIGMSDSENDIIPGQFSKSWSRSVSAYKILQNLQAQRLPMDIYTRLGLYKNMVVESIDTPEDYKTLNALKATVTFREILVAEVMIVKVSSRPQITNKTTKGQVEVVKPKESVALQGVKKIIGQDAAEKFVRAATNALTGGWR